MRWSPALAAITVALVLLLLPESSQAQAGRVHRATRRRTAVVVGTTVHARDEAEYAEREAAEAQAEQKAAAQQPAAAPAAAPAPNVPPPAAAAPLAIGAVVTTLPAGCTSMSVSGTQYYNCGSNYYRASFQGNNLVYVTTEAPK